MADYTKYLSTWDATIEYEIKDLVVHEGKIYRSKFGTSRNGKNKGRIPNTRKQIWWTVIADNPISIFENGTSKTTNTTGLDFIGEEVTISVDELTKIASITISSSAGSALEIKGAGTTITSDAISINFTGDCDVTGDGAGNITVDVTGGDGGALEYGKMKLSSANNSWFLADTVYTGKFDSPGEDSVDLSVSNGILGPYGSLGDNSFVEGLNTTANGDTSHAEGNTTTADSDNSHAEGYESVANLYAGHASASGKFSEAGDAQYQRAILRTVTINDTETVMRIAGASDLTDITKAIVLSATNAKKFECNILASDDACMNTASFKIEGVVSKSAVGDILLPWADITAQYKADDLDLCNVDINVETSTNELQILVTGLSGDTINWVGTIHLIEFGS